MKLLTLLVLIFSSFAARAANVVTSDVTNQGVVKKWHILMDANHQPAMRDDQRTFTDFTFFFDYQANASNSFRVLQAPTKQYEVLEGESEWQASDTIFYHYWNTGKKLGPARLRWVTSVALPTSQASADQNKVTTVTGTLQANSLFFGRLMLSARPYLRYNWYEYKTSKGGTPLSAWVYGLNMVSSYQLSSKFSLNATFGYSVIYDYASQYDASTGGFNTTASQTTGRYDISLSGNYEWSDKMATYVSIAQGDAYIRDGRYELYAYEPEVTRAGLGLTLYF